MRAKATRHLGDCRARDCALRMREALPTMAGFEPATPSSRTRCVAVGVLGPIKRKVGQSPGFPYIYNVRVKKWPTFVQALVRPHSRQSLHSCHLGSLSILETQREYWEWPNAGGRSRSSMLTGWWRVATWSFVHHIRPRSDSGLEKFGRSGRI